jgi:hypothetical protein
MSIMSLLYHVTLKMSSAVNMQNLQALSNEALEQLLSIQADLSPENLTCDGELADAQVTLRYRALLGRLQEFQREHRLSNAEVEEGAVYSEWRRRKPRS